MRRLGAVLRSHLFDVLFGIWTCLVGLGIPFFWLAGSPSRPIRVATRLWARGTLALLRHVVGLSYVKQGVSPESDGPFLIISNHQSQWETIAFLAVFPEVAIVAKQELLRIPVVSWYLARSPMIVIDRGAGSAALKLMLTQSVSAAADGRSVLIFPEGKRMPVTEPIAFRRGVELLYSRLNMPMLPVVVNSGKFWNAALRHKRAGTVTVSLLPLIRPGLKPATVLAQARTRMENERNRTSGSSFDPVD